MNLPNRLDAILLKVLLDLLAARDCSALLGGRGASHGDSPHGLARYTRQRRAPCMLAARRRAQIAPRTRSFAHASPAQLYQEHHETAGTIIRPYARDTIRSDDSEGERSDSSRLWWRRGVDPRTNDGSRRSRAPYLLRTLAPPSH
ncbi:unnamed protein product [Arctia plantaginis]|uniref:Secreted protein n=1 Tax=Arctia plantaginis TaxID=874455 RepID=A0A8S0ZJ62_ARCPL|nr:unnamed protein product [Arctia plantaginis]